MNDRPIRKVLHALGSINAKAPSRNGKGWSARCPAHDDQRPSLSVSEGDDGRALIHCHTGCLPEAIVAALGLSMRDLQPTDDSDTDKKPARRSRPRVLSDGEPNRSSAVFPAAHDAVEALEKKHGPRAASWIYRDADGEPVGVVVRWNHPDGTKKDIRPVSRNGVGWTIGAMPKPRLLYRLAELSAATRVYVVEGEPAADALCELGLTATTAAGGCNAAGATDWSPLADKACTIWPDKDDPGAHYADDVARLVASHAPGGTIKRIKPPDIISISGDAADFVAAWRKEGLVDDEIRVLVEQFTDDADVVEPPTTALSHDTYQPFPVEILPEPIRSFIVKAARSKGCDASYVALPLLSALAATIGSTRRIRLKSDWSEPAIIWTAIVGESGSKKTPALELAIEPLAELQTEAFKRSDEQLAEYETQLQRYERDHKKWQRGKTDDEPPTKPQPPAQVRHIVSDTTIEALAPILLANPRGVLLVRDELAGWIGSFDRYAGKGGADMASWLSMHTAGGVTVDRKTGPQRTLHVASAVVSVAGGIQPGILDRKFGHEQRDAGLLARMLLAMPPRQPSGWNESELPEAQQRSIRAVFRRLYALQPIDGENGDPSPQFVSLTPEARRALIMFIDAHGLEQAGLTGDVAAAYSKLEAYAARLALVVHCVRAAADDPTLTSADTVDVCSINAGIQLARWFGREARRVYGYLGATEADREHMRLVELILRPDRSRPGGSVSVRQWQRLRSHQSAQAAEDELSAMVDAGFGRWDFPAQRGAGRPRSRRFVLNGQGGNDKTPRDSSE